MRFLNCTYGSDSKFVITNALVSTIGCRRFAHSSAKESARRHSLEWTLGGCTGWCPWIDQAGWTRLDHVALDRSQDRSNLRNQGARSQAAPGQFRTFADWNGCQVEDVAWTTPCQCAEKTRRRASAWKSKRRFRYLASHSRTGTATGLHDAQNQAR